ncbi:hypothetical protein PQ478_08880 [Alkalihalophilus pseudofirmus]|uniref:hypothetical protein n=1 Tax=Alkalihalophilus pseudofirmus TaxID=79885 RepID=UPI00259AF8D9|nr:hypothetical protein [Alkalihalophilus pseudofirmus]WEG18584.1 hypothetical protein PQ478_08880 [Alkalihalophilus pseudofirmus]
MKDIEDMTWGEIEEKIGQVRFAVYILSELFKSDQSHLESIETQDDKYEAFIKGELKVTKKP